MNPKVLQEQQTQANSNTLSRRSEIQIGTFRRKAQTQEPTLDPDGRKLARQLAVAETG